jgi:hypothetical protein
MKDPARSLILLAIVSTLAVTIAYQFTPPYRINIAPGDNPYIRDFWDLETDPQGGSFRWTKAKSEIIFHNAGQILPPGRPITLELRLASARPPDVDPPEAHLTLSGGAGQDLGTIQVPSQLGTLRFGLDPARTGDRDWALEIDSETFQPAGESRELGVSVRRATLRVDDTQPPLWPRFPSALYAILIPLFLFVSTGEVVSRTPIKTYSSPLSFAVALGAMLALASGIAVYRELTVLYLPLLLVLSMILGAWALSRILRSNGLTAVLDDELVYRATWSTGLVGLVIGEAIIWLTDQIVLGAFLLIAGAAITYLSIHLRSGVLPPAQAGAPSRTELLLLGGITLLAMALRVYRLDQVLFGLFRDETRMGLLGLRVLSDPNYRPIYEGPPISQSGLLLYLLAFSFRFFGANIFSLRLVGAIAGALTVPLLWRLVRDWFPLSPLRASARWVGGGAPLIALVAAFGLAIGTMHVYYSRFTLPYVESPLLSIPAYILLARGLKDGRWRNYALAGCFFGATQYASQVSRVSWLVGAFLVVDEILTRRALPRNFVRGAFVLCVAALIVLAPLLSFVAQHPNEFLARTGQVSLFNEQTSSGDYPVTLLWNNVAAYAAMFNVVGDSHGGHVVPTRPEFDPVFGVLFVIGFLQGVRRWRESAYRRVLFWLFAALLPGLLSIEAPAPLRVLEAPAPTFILAALGAWWLLQSVSRVIESRAVSPPSRDRERGKVGAISYALPLLAALALIVNSRVYFGELGNDPRLWQKNQGLSTPLGATLGEWHRQNQIPGEAVVYAPDWLLGEHDDRDVLNFLTNSQMKFVSLSKAPSILPSPALIVRPNIVGYWKTIVARQQDSPKIVARWTEEDAQTQEQIRALAGTRDLREMRGPVFPDSDEPAFWLYVVR